MEKTRRSTKLNNNGSGLIFATLIMFVILVIVVTLSSVTVMEMKMSQKTKSSVKSFFNAESGVEWALNKIATTDKETIAQAFNDSNPSDGINCPFGVNECKIYLLDSANNVITSGSTKLSEVKAVRSVGTSKKGYETQRAIEAAVAGGSLPSGMIAMFDVDCPAGWTRFSSLDGYFPMGARRYSSRSKSLIAVSPPCGSNCGRTYVWYKDVVWCKKD